MNLLRIPIEKMNRGDLIPTPAGLAVADTLSTDSEGNPFWWDTDGSTHYWGKDGFAVKAQIGVRTQEIGRIGQERHALLSGVQPAPDSVCGISGDLLDVWELGTALASVTCRDCRSQLNLVARYR